MPSERKKERKKDFIYYFIYYVILEAFNVILFGCCASVKGIIKKIPEF